MSLKILTWLLPCSSVPDHTYNSAADNSNEASMGERAASLFQISVILDEPHLRVLVTPDGSQRDNWDTCRLRSRYGIERVVACLLPAGSDPTGSATGGTFFYPKRVNVKEQTSTHLENPFDQLS